MGDTAWTEQVVGRGETFVANATAEFSSYFPDHALINDLGCEAAINIPVTDASQVVGTVNILDAAGHFTPARVQALEELVAARRDDLLGAFAAVTLKEGS
jgi:hypothetical protein